MVNMLVLMVTDNDSPITGNDSPITGNDSPITGNDSPREIYGAIYC